MVKFLHNGFKIKYGIIVSKVLIASLLHENKEILTPAVTSGVSDTVGCVSILLGTDFLRQATNYPPESRVGDASLQNIENFHNRII